MKILAGLWMILMVGTVLAHLFNVGFLPSAQILLGSLIALGAGLGAKGAYYSGSLFFGLVLGAILSLFSWLILPSPLRLGPSLWLPSVWWIIASAVIGFLFGNRQDAGSAARR